MSEPTYLLQIWEDDDKNSKDDWSLGYHFITDPQEILDRIKKFKRNNSKWHEWKPSIYLVKEIDIDIKVTSEAIRSHMGVGTIWLQINEELKNK